MSNLEKLKKSQLNKAKGTKVAEIIWLSIGGLILLSGIACLVLTIIINNIGTDTTNMYSNPLFFLVEAQDAFVEWFVGWSKIEISSFNDIGIGLIVIAAIYLLIVFAVYGAKQDAADKKAKAKKLRESNARKFLEEQKLNEEKRESELQEVAE